MEVILHTKMETMNKQISEIMMNCHQSWTHDLAKKQRLEELKEQTMKRLDRLKLFTTYGLPIIAFVFLVGFFLVGFCLV